MFTFSWTCSFDFSKLLRGKLLGASSQAGSAGPCHQSWYYSSYYIIIAVSVSMCVMSRYVSIFCMIWLNNSLASVRVVIGTCLWKVSSAKGAIWINVDQFGAKCKMLLKHHQGLKGNAAHQHIRILERNKKDGGQRAFWDFLMSRMLQPCFSPTLTTPIHSPADRTSTPVSSPRTRSILHSIFMCKQIFMS